MVLKLVSPNGDQRGRGSLAANGCTGYPAQLTVFVTYTLNNAGQLAHPLPGHNDSKT